MLFRTTCFLYLLVLSLGSFAAGFPPGYYLGIEQGLSNNDVTCIFQTHDGMMWFGTFDGLNRYDGSGFRVFRKNIGRQHSLVANHIQDMAEDVTGNLWIATNGGVSVYSPLLQSFTDFAYEEQEGKKQGKVQGVTGLLADSNNDMLVGSAKEGLIVFSWRVQKARQVGLAYHGHVLYNYEVGAIARDAGDMVWLMVNGVGLCQYRRKSNSLVLIDTTVKEAISIRGGKTGDLWVGGGNMIYKYVRNRGAYGESMSLPFPVTSLLPDVENNLWITTDGGGMYRMPPGAGGTPSLSLQKAEVLFPGRAIKAIWEDSAGRYWIANLRGGINLIDAHRHLFTTINLGYLKKERAGNDQVSAFCEDGAGNIWIGTDGNGLACWQRQANKFSSFTKENGSGLGSNNITSIINGDDHQLWIATWGGGVYKYTHGKGFASVGFRLGRQVISRLNAWSLYREDNGNVWAGTYGNGGLFLWDRKSGCFELFDGTIGNVLTMAADKRGDVWAGTDNRLVKIDKSKRRRMYYEIGCRVRAILPDNDSCLWVGTEGSGLLHFNILTGRFTQFTETNGLPSESVLNILPGNDGYLWLSTSNGLSKFYPPTGRCRNFSTSDGLQSSQFSYAGALKLRSGELLFGGLKGFNIFDPKQIVPPRNYLAAMVTGIQIDNSPVGDSGNIQYIKKSNRQAVTCIEIPFERASLSFEYTALNYSAPDKIIYAYRLEGWDNNWVYAGKARTAFYSRLPEGVYTLHIKAGLGPYDWGPDTLLKVIVLSAWYRTWWAYSCYLLLASLLCWMYASYRRKQSAMAYEVRLAQVETSREKESNEKKVSFFTNIIHELRTPLTLIVNPVKELLDGAEEWQKTSLKTVHRNASRLLALADQLIMFSTAENDIAAMDRDLVNLSQLCKETFDCFCQVVKSRNIRYEFECHNPQLEIYADARKLEICFFNLLSNAIKFTPANGSVKMGVYEVNDVVKIVVTDTGCGIGEDMKDHLFEKYYRGKNRGTANDSGFGIGLHLVKKFVDLHEGSLQCNSTSDVGTSFTLTLKYDKPVAGMKASLAPAAGSGLTDSGMVFLPHAIELSAPDVLEITEKRSLLIVDDNLELRQYLTTSFAAQFQVLEAVDGNDGWNIVKQFVPDIVISDVIMPGIDGITLCSKIKADASLKHIPVILVSAVSSPALRLQGMESGAEDYMVKPFLLEMLAAKISSVLSNRNALQQYFKDSITLKSNINKISATYKEFMDKCIQVVESNLDNEALGPAFLAEQCHMSYPNFYRKVKTISGLSVTAFIRSIRLRKAAYSILSTDMNVNEAAFQAGISDIKYFRKQFKNLYGMNPSEYRKKYQHSFNNNFNVMVRKQRGDL